MVFNNNCTLLLVFFKHSWDKWFCKVIFMTLNGHRDYSDFHQDNLCSSISLFPFNFSYFVNYY